MSGLLRKKAMVALLIAVVAIMSLGAIFTAETMMEEGAMHNCPYMGVPALCTMSPLEHLSGWQQMFAATVEQ